MSIQATARAFAKFTAAYPTSRRPDEATVAFWAGELHRYPDHLIESCATQWIQHEVRYPSLPAFLEVIRAHSPQRVIDTPRCGICEDGWIFEDDDGPGTVQKCPNGCLPPPMQSQTTLQHVEEGVNQRWAVKVSEARAAQARHRSELGDDAYLTESGYDPAEYRIEKGMILKRVSA
jgi:hypothetical protein